MSVVEIHEVNDEICDKINALPEDTVLSFDDGLYTQYLYKDKIKLKNRIYAICPALVNTANDQVEDFVICYDAMYTHFYDDSNKYYMNVNNIKQLITDGYKIAAHSNTHETIKYAVKNPKYFKKIPEIENYSFIAWKGNYWVKNDTEALLKWFKEQLDLVPTIYVYPFDEKTDKIEELLKTYNFTEFYGSNRASLAQ